jgi:hypothetical protein
VVETKGTKIRPTCLMALELNSSQLRQCLIFLSERKEDQITGFCSTTLISAESISDYNTVSS